MKRPSISNVVVALMVLFVGVALGQNRGAVQIVTIRDTLAVAAFQQKLDDLTLERDGIRARLEGVEARAPQVVYVTDTLVSPPDTVIRFLSVDAAGSLSVELLTARDTLYAPEIHAGIDISDCDEGYQIADGEVLCDRARLGHLWLGPVLATRPAVMVWWKPSYRSPWEGGIGFSGRWEFYIRRGIRLW